MHGQIPRTRRDSRHLLPVCMMLGLGMLSGCNDTVDAPDTFEYVALGDSFTAAGLPPPAAPAAVRGGTIPICWSARTPSRSWST